MLLHKISSRLLHTTTQFFANVEKSSLAALRKNTGYTFANCKKALELNNNDIKLAENWLNEQAQSMGWSKATKLADRATAQGLVGVLIRNNIGVMVEVNCETDFVARNEHFRKFVDRVSRVCAQYSEMSEFDGDLWKMGFEVEALKHLKTDDNKTLADDLALLIGTVGENATIKRSICFKANNEVQLSGYAHPAPIESTNNNTEDIITPVGKYGTIVAFRSSTPIPDELKKNLCQHIVGMNPSKVGEIGKDIPVANKDDESCLIFQEYLLDADRTVGEILKEHDISILDYKRFECGDLAKGDELQYEKLRN